MGKKPNTALYPALKVWIQQQYNTIGFHANGTPIAKAKFKNHIVLRLPQEYKEEENKAREFVNTLYRDGALVDITDINGNAGPTPAPYPSAPPVETPLQQQTSLAFREPPPHVHRAVSVHATQDPTGGVPLEEHAQEPVPPVKPPPRLYPVPLNPQIKELKAFVGSLQNHILDEPQNGYSDDRSLADDTYDMPSLKDQLCLLDSHPEDQEDQSVSANDISNATIFTSHLLPTYRALLPQFSLLGTFFPTHSPPTPNPDRRLFLNTNIPWSAFICGVQGSGKSHTMSCLIENSLISSRTLGILKRPLSALIFYLGQYTSRINFRPCEAAFLSYPSPQFTNAFTPPPVRVFVSPSNLHNLRAAYTDIPNITVHPLLLQPRHLNISAMLALMSVDTSQSAPLYMAQVVKTLRDMAAELGEFEWSEFRKRIKALSLTKMQRGPLEQRVELLESFLDLKGEGEALEFADGGVTVVDLSCPFVDENTACVLFNICMGVYLGGDGVGKIVAVDEAHKYLTDTPAAKILTESLLSVIRQQRHYGARVIISTQEPTISPRLIDLCSMVVTHRFTSPEWFSALRKHISTPDEEGDGAELFGRILELRVGEALVFAPQGVVGVEEGIRRLNSGLVRVRVRKRLTWDGGKSIVCL